MMEKIEIIVEDQGLEIDIEIESTHDFPPEYPLDMLAIYQLAKL